MTTANATATAPAPSFRASASATSTRPWWPWVLTFAAFPPAGYLGQIVAGPVDSVPAALLAGLVTGAVLGLGQWALLRRRGVSLRWAVATAGAMAVGLAAGAGLVSFHTDLLSIAVMGLVSGFAVGASQAVSVRREPAAVALWAAATAVLWAVGWIVSSGVIDLADQWPVFGASGALLVTLAQAPFVTRITR